jgi:hypothetical protein
MNEMSKVNIKGKPLNNQSPRRGNWKFGQVPIMPIFIVIFETFFGGAGTY